jgi:hypothetical protein
VTGRRWGRNPGLFVVGGQVPSPEDLRPAPPAGGPLEHGSAEDLPVGDESWELTADNVDAIAAAIHWDRAAADEPYQRDVTRTMDDTTRMGNSLSAAVRLELLAADMRAAVRDERSAAERTADQLAAVDECETGGGHALMLSGQCALCGRRFDPVSGDQLDADGQPIDQGEDEDEDPCRPREDTNQPDLDAVRDAWEATAELPRITEHTPLTVADLHAELTPRTYAAPRPVPPADEVVTVTPEQARAVGGAPRRVLNWTSRHDPASLAFGVRARLSAPAPLVDKTWQHGPILDQGTAPPLSLHDASGCTGHAAVNAANVLALAHLPASAPIHAEDLYGHEDAMRAYDRAQELDDVPGQDYPGTSVLAAMKAGQEFGWWSSYSWAFGTRDVAQALLQVGPVVIGIPWLSGMTTPSPDGIITVGGEDQGGHCLCLFALRMSLAGRAGPWFGALQTWGESVGDHGVIWFHHKDMARLLHAVGEAAIPHQS